MRALDRIAVNIKKIRLEKNISQEKLAELSGLHRTYISQIERKVKNPTVNNLEKIADALNTDITELLKE
ncbi:helix-turn-helix transcriptional regulator [Salipaludibacillus sp. CUR1]|uniref:helix-turn-helix domain-containing protein n=1 Tax=Salipaludibacillus sp. CUR1 TaxID=2820003 RepID=UPI001E3DA638|nr:helix-turn-helix transcriptional regulator [Salipaludibacillus sp. CUR1]MCE7792211.1 helix-turn-helix transcriptional regulator [Salipaludibacillus sp. CUR1]